MVYAFASEKFVEWLIGRQVASGNRKEIYAYYMERFLAAVGNLMILVLFSIIFGKVKEVATVVLFYSSLRNASGGAHAKNHTRCMGGYLVLVAIIITLAGLVSGLQYFRIIIAAALAVSNIIIIRYAPVGCTNREFDAEEIEVKRKRSITIAATETFVVLGLMLITKNINYYIGIAALALLTQALTLLPIINRIGDGE